VAAELATSEANIVHLTMDEEANETGTLRFTLQVRSRRHPAQADAEPAPPPRRHRMVRR
jgi:hypothetical protein